jgi:hypothetical protein
METTPQTNEAVTTSKNYHKSLAESIVDMKLTLDNATLPGIVEVMQSVGYTAEKLSGMSSKLALLEQLSQTKTKEDADQSDEQQTFDDKRNDVSQTFVKHRTLLRILFNQDVHARVSLRLEGSIPKAYANWIDMVSNFYGQLSSQPELLTKTTGVGITSAVVADCKQALSDLNTLKESLKKETAEAQAATEARDQAYDAIYPLYSEYISYAKVLLADNQLLESIGVKVE